MRRGSWHRYVDGERERVGWLPFDDREPPRCEMEVESERDALILRDVLDALDATPKGERR